ncbi:MAG: hypothetical protein NW215_05405 [Hyphomicrobiales bacterium]|nr:hypothetical protein [Hyphomicrobiales bacterium]
MRFIWAFVMAFALGVSAHAQDASPVAKKAPAKGGSRIVIYWEQAPINVLVPGLVPKWLSGRADVELNGKFIGKLGWAEVITASVPPGTHYVRQDVGFRLFDYKGAPIKVAPGQTAYVRARKEQYTLFFDQVPTSRALIELAEIKKYR